jgi:yersiniabactin nonribosomal peptide synthetase
MNGRAAPPTREQLLGPISHALGLPVEAVRDDQNLVELGLTSLEVMRLVNRWRRQGIDLDYDDLAANPTFGHWWELLIASRGETQGFR